MLDPAARKLSVRARATELASVPLVSVSKLVFAPIFGDAEVPPLAAPAIWTIVEGPGDTDRETIAPTTLRPYSGADEEEPETVSPAPSTPAKPGDGSAPKPTTYRVRLDVGWQLLVTDQAPRLGWSRRLVAAVRDGWQRLRGQEPAHPPLVAIVVAPEDARRLHHIFRTGTRMLVLASD